MKRVPGERLATPVELELIKLVRQRMDFGAHVEQWEREQAEWWDSMSPKRGIGPSPKDLGPKTYLTGDAEGGILSP